MIVPFHVIDMLKRVRQKIADNDNEAPLQPHYQKFSSLRPVRKATLKSVGQYWKRLKALPNVTEEEQQTLADQSTLDHINDYQSNIENFIGTIKVPTGIIGPLRVNGVHAQGDYCIPLATTEAALVASYGRGAYVATKSGGISTAVLYEGVLRTPAFVFETLSQSGYFVEWIIQHIDTLKETAQTTTRFGKLVSLEPVIENNVVFLLCRFTTGDAAGQNMVTIATNSLCQIIEKQCSIPIHRWYIEGNFSGDKKASFLGMMTGRGRKVSASVIIPAPTVKSTLHTTTEEMLAYGRIANLGALFSGQLGAQAHYANGLAALYLATGQDAACVAESAVGFTRMEARGEDLFCSVTMPNILVGSVGGGTSLPSQRAGLNILGLQGEGHGAALAEVTAALCLCGELSIVAAISAGHFAHAHQNLARLR